MCDSLEKLQRSGVRYGGPVEGPPQTPRTSRQCGRKGFKGILNWTPIVLRGAFLIADVIFPVQQDVYRYIIYIYEDVYSYI